MKGIGILVILIGLIWAERHYHLSAYLTPAQIESWLAETGSFAPVVFIVVMAASVIISPLPSLPLDILAGSFFGPSSLVERSTGERAGPDQAQEDKRLCRRRRIGYAHTRQSARSTSFFF